MGGNYPAVRRVHEGMGASVIDRAKLPSRTWIGLSAWRVGVAGFEPTASSSRTKRATKLRHTPYEATTAYRTGPSAGQTAN